MARARPRRIRTTTRRLTETKQSIALKKKYIKENKVCFMCSSTDHCAKKCRQHNGKKPQTKQKTMNMVTNTGNGTSGYGYLPSVPSIYHLMA
jgi:hypothetical protein